MNGLVSCNKSSLLAGKRAPVLKLSPFTLSSRLTEAATSAIMTIDFDDNRDMSWLSAGERESPCCGIKCIVCARAQTPFAIGLGSHGNFVVSNCY